MVESFLGINNGVLVTSCLGNSCHLRSIDSSVLVNLRGLDTGDGVGQVDEAAIATLLPRWLPPLPACLLHPHKSRQDQRSLLRLLGTVDYWLWTAHSKCCWLIVHRESLQAGLHFVVISCIWTQVWNPLLLKLLNARYHLRISCRCALVDLVLDADLSLLDDSRVDVPSHHSVLT